MFKRAAWGSSWTAVVGLTAAIAGALLLAGGAAATTVGVNLDQCANGAAGSPSSCPPGWQNGNLNGSNSSYREGDSVPFRVILTKLAPGDHALVIQYDTMQSGKHAYDYLTRYDRTVGGLDACDGVSGCSGPGANSDTIPLSDNPSVPSPFVSDPNRYFTIWNADAIGTPTLGGASDAAGQQSVTIPFTTTTSDPVVIAWGGHVADEINWGAGNAAGGINGSPYHMRVVSLDGDATGHQDRSMQANAVAPAPPTFVTDVESASEAGGYVGTIQPGDSVTDNALLSGDNGPASGTVTFFWCYAASGTPDCTTGGTRISEEVVSELGTATSDTFTPDGSGTYCFRAEYWPDGNSLYSPTNETNALVESNGNHGECFRVSGGTSLLPSSVSTDINDANGVVTTALVGSTVHDVATVHGSALTPNGSVTFALFSGTGCSGDPLSTETVDLADGSARSSNATVPKGGLSYRVQYNGNDDYDESDGLCENLSSTVTPPSTPPSTPPTTPPTTPAPPARSIDLSIAKAVSPSPAALGSVVTWTLIVRNNGPDSATGVKVADPLPAGVTFVSVGAGQGTCTGGPVINCDLGTVASGAVVVILVRTTVTSTGSIVNTSTVVGNEAETATTNNTGSATLAARGALKPPAQFCTAVAVSPKSIFVGRHSLLTMRVSQNGKAVAGIRVRIKGSTLGIVTKQSNAKGIVKVHVSPKRPGIVNFAPVAHKRCTSPRIGVVGVFTPPVTG